MLEYVEFAAVTADGPLWLGKLNPRTAVSVETLANMIGDILARPSDGEMQLNPYFRAIGADWPSRSLTAGKLRHFAEGTSWDAGLDHVLEHRDKLSNTFQARALPGDPQVFADALLDHAMGTLSHRYKDAASEEGRARYGRVAALGVYDYVLGERGAQRSLDLEAIAQAQQTFTVARASEAATLNEIDRIERRLLSTDVKVLNPGERELYLLELAQSQIHCFASHAR